MSANLEELKKENTPMQTHAIATHIIIVASLALMPLIAAPSAEAAGKKPKASASPTQSQAEGRTTVAAGAAEDSQAACLKRIPQNATAGQRMLAEDSCKRDQSSR